MKVNHIENRTSSRSIQKGFQETHPISNTIEFGIESSPPGRVRPASATATQRERKLQHGIGHPHVSGRLVSNSINIDHHFTTNLMIVKIFTNFTSASGAFAFYFFYLYISLDPYEISVDCEMIFSLEQMEIWQQAFDMQWCVVREMPLRDGIWSLVVHDLFCIPPLGSVLHFFTLLIIVNLLITPWDCISPRKKTFPNLNLIAKRRFKKKKLRPRKKFD